MIVDSDIKVLNKNQPGIYSARWATEDNYTHAFKLIKNKIESKGKKSMDSLLSLPVA